MKSTDVISIEELALIIKMDKRTIQNRIYNELPMPPCFKIPSSKSWLWRRSDVDAWINQVADEYIAAEKSSKEKFQELTSIKELREKKFK